MMTWTDRVRKFAAAAVLGSSLAATPATAEAGFRGLRGAFGAALISGAALGIMAAAASAQAAQPIYIEGPDETPVFEEIRSARSRPVARSLKSAASRTVRGASKVLDNCRSHLLEASRRHGGVRVSVAVAGPARGAARSLEVPINARVEYAKAGTTVVRQARVTCRVDGVGKAIAVRSIRGQAVSSR